MIFALKDKWRDVFDSCFQAYHEELLQSSPRRKLFNDYAKQLLKRYPSLKEEINQRIHHLNGHWQTLQKVVLPQNGFQDAKTMLSGELPFFCRMTCYVDF